ncbi:MAG: prolipoprotein diacylglyceryl transferase [Planctomycetes bacterium]|nr:prolipoprotein diacylglyceryl transferase [Planctomycetota bacterium]
MKTKIVSFNLFGLDVSIYTYGTLIVVGFLVGAWWLRRAAERTLGVDRERSFNVAFALLFLGLFGARLCYAIAHYEEFARTPLKFLKIWEGGLLLFGGVALASLWLAWWLPRKPEMRGFALADLLARATCLALAVGWMAPLLAGDDFGKPTTLPWGIPAAAYEDGSPASLWAIKTDVPLASLHPTQVYEALFALALFFGLGLLGRRARVSGRVLAAFFVAMAVGRAALDLFRGDGGPAAKVADRGFVVPGVLSWTQFLAIPLAFAGVALWLIRRPGAAPASPPPRAP